MNVVNSLIKPVVVVGALVVGFGVAQAQQMMPQGMMMPHGMMPQQRMMPQQGMMPQQRMMPQQGMMPQQRMMPQQGMMPQQQMNPLAMLKLSDEQQQKLKDLATEAQKQGAELVKLLGESAKELPKLMADVKLDAKTIGAAYAKVFDIQRKIIEAGVTNYNKELAVFTEEQRKVWDAMRKQMQGFNQAPR